MHENHLDEEPASTKEILKNDEIHKTETEVQIIGAVNRVTNDLMRNVGVEPYDIPLNNFHVLPHELYEKLVSSDRTIHANVDYSSQAIFMDGDDFKDPVNFAEVTFHEALHFKGKLVIEVNKDNKGKRKARLYRKGISVRNTQKSSIEEGNQEYFTGLHEAMVAQATIDNFNIILSDPSLKSEKEWLASPEALQMKKRIAEINNIPIEEIYWVSKDGKGANRFPNKAFRDVYAYVVSEMILAHAETITAEEVKNEFLKSHFTGHLIKIAHLVEDTFGPGSFRLFGTMNTKENAEEVMNSLKEARARIVNTVKES